MTDTTQFRKAFRDPDSLSASQTITVAALLLVLKPAVWTVVAVLVARWMGVAI